MSTKNNMKNQLIVFLCVNLFAFAGIFCLNPRELESLGEEAYGLIPLGLLFGVFIFMISISIGFLRKLIKAGESKKLVNSSN